jgi:two-component system OmpR family sensor kinase
MTVPDGTDPDRRQWTLRGRLVAALLVLATAGLTVFGVSSVVLIRGSMIDRIDRSLEDFPDRPRPLAPPLPPPLGRDELPTDFRVLEFDPKGAPLVLLGQQAGDNAGPVLPALDQTAAVRLSRAPFTVDDRAGGPSWRTRIIARADGRITAVSLSLATVEATLQRLVLIEFLVGGAVLVVLGTVGIAVVRLGLRPLTRIEHTAQRIAGGELDLRVPEANQRTETGRLGAALNTMLGRISSALRQRQQSEDRLRSFVADASHELRTPLTSIRGFAELYRRGGAAEPGDVARMMRRIEDEATRMGLLVDDLLLLARLNQERSLDLTEVDLRALAEDAVHDARVRDPGRTVALDTPGKPVRVTADEPRLRQVLANLLDNALSHTPLGTTVTVSVRRRPGGGGPPVAVAGATETRRGGHAVLEVADDGTGIPVDTARHVFDRFYRADPARSRGQGGAGLGLAITAAILEAHDGRVELRTAAGAGAAFRVLLPAD